MADGKPMSFRGAAIIQFASKYASIAIQLIITAVLARLITPEAFGEVAIVTVFTGFFALFSELGIGTAIVQFRELQPRDFDKLFSFSLLLSLVLGALFAVLAPLIAMFYGNQGLVGLLLAAVPSLVFNTLNMVPNGLMLRGKRFKEIGLRLVVATVVSGLFACLCAWQGLGAYALVIQSDLSAIVIFFWNFAHSSLRRFDFRFMEPLRVVFSYSSFQFGFNIINYFARNLDNLLIGKVFGDASLGYYDKAYKLTTYPLSSFSSILADIVQPYMAEHQNEPDVVYEFWFKITKFISLVGAALAAALMACASQVVMIVYGSQWEPSVPLFAVLAVSIYPQMLSSSTGAFFQSLGRTDLMFRAGVICTAITLGCLVVGLVSRSLLVTTGLVALAFLVNLGISYYLLLRRAFGKSMRVLLRLAPEILTGLAGALLAVVVGQFLPSGTFVQLFGKGLVVLMVVGGVYFVTGQLRFIKTVLAR